MYASTSALFVYKPQQSISLSLSLSLWLPVSVYVCSCVCFHLDIFCVELKAKPSLSLTLALLVAAAAAVPDSTDMLVAISSLTSRCTILQRTEVTCQSCALRQAGDRPAGWRSRASAPRQLACQSRRRAVSNRGTDCTRGMCSGRQAYVTWPQDARFSDRAAYISALITLRRRQRAPAVQRRLPALTRNDAQATWRTRRESRIRRAAGHNTAVVFQSSESDYCQDVGAAADGGTWSWCMAVKVSTLSTEKTKIQPFSNLPGWCHTLELRKTTCKRRRQTSPPILPTGELDETYFSIVFDSDPFAPLCENMTSSTNRIVRHTALPSERTEPRSRLTVVQIIGLSRDKNSS